MMKALFYGGCATATAASRSRKVNVNVVARGGERVFPMLGPRAGAARSIGGPRRPSDALLGDIEARRAQEVERCAAKGWKSALVCLENMVNGGVSPGTRAFNIALKACALAGEWDRAAALLRDMRACGVAPDAAVVSDVSENLDIHEATASGNPGRKHDRSWRP